MTRINVISPRKLSGKHLVAEYRELPRVFGLVRRAQARGETPSVGLAGRYTMGKGHVRFFYARLEWLCRRYRRIVAEMKRRGYNPQYDEPQTRGIYAEWFGDYIPSRDDIETNMARLRERDAEFYCSKNLK